MEPCELDLWRFHRVIRRREGVFRDFPPFSRRGKPISSKFYRLPAARRRFSEDFSPFPPQKMTFRRIFPVSRRGKAFFGDFSPFPAAGRRFSKVLIGFVRREGVLRSPRSVSRFILAFRETGNRLCISGDRITKSQAVPTFVFRGQTEMTSQIIVPINC